MVRFDDLLPFVLKGVYDVRESGKYNRIIEFGDSLLIYNSLSGIKSLCKINKPLHPQLCESLQTGSELECCNDEYNRLISNGVLTPKNSEEESYRLFLQYSSEITLILLPVCLYLLYF